MKLLFLLVFSISSIFAQTTLCYKNGLEKPDLDENRILLGGECSSVYTSKQMQSNGWKLEDSKVLKVKDKYNHVYIFSKLDTLDKFLQNRKSGITAQVTKKQFKQKDIILSDVTRTSATISIGNLEIGQSGIVVNSRGTNAIIVTQGIVTESSKKSSKIKFIEYDILKQKAIPTLNIKPIEGDLFVLNHLYSTSLLIVPNAKAKKVVLNTYKKQNFLSEDFFATYLKLNNTPVPTRKDIIEFCQQQQIGTIYFVVENTLYIVDAISFRTVDTITLPINDSTTSSPFLTKIDKIDTAFWDYLGATKISDYNDYYLSMINNTTYNPSSADYEEEDKSILRRLMEYLPW